MTYAHSAQAIVDVAASPEALFDYLDDQVRVGSHMQKPSMMMLGGRMSYEFDDAQGRAVGSVIRMQGNILGLVLSVEEVVIERRPPRRKAWETRGDPNLLVIGAYRMGFEISASGETSRLRVFINYDYPATFAGKFLGSLCAPMYARWCVNRMAKDAADAFEAAGGHRSTAGMGQTMANRP
ncbi:SRPBCC family protein [Sinorhizobium fredii]|uniref:SRPBCC family protein n=1 Tax=Rhizobium fredii TaxID=380 RepID=UPI0003149DB1|nr:SRPBCC family protein [Sinorhizobium fredii]MQW97189.1 SRPBCC family protein [Sinorhizobium fredii]UTY50474.1 SRPBCC family protein [Sinorhizobium fredii]